MNKPSTLLAVILSTSLLAACGGGSSGGGINGLADLNGLSNTGGGGNVPTGGLGGLENSNVNGGTTTPDGPVVTPQSGSSSLSQLNGDFRITYSAQGESLTDSSVFSNASFDSEVGGYLAASRAHNGAIACFPVETVFVCASIVANEAQQVVGTLLSVFQLRSASRGEGVFELCGASIEACVDSLIASADGTVVVSIGSGAPAKVGSSLTITEQMSILESQAVQFGELSDPVSAEDAESLRAATANLVTTLAK